MDLLILALLAAVIVLLIVVIAKQNKPQNTAAEQKLDALSEKTTELSRTLGSEFERSRRESTENQHNMRMETSARLTEMSEKIENIRVNNLEQSARQSKALTEAVDRMRESNEKKLEEMRVTVDEKLTSTLTQRLDSSFKTVSDRLENVYKSLGEMKELSNGVTANVTALNKVLLSPSGRTCAARSRISSTSTAKKRCTSLCPPATWYPSRSAAAPLAAKRKPGKWAIRYSCAGMCKTHTCSTMRPSRMYKEYHPA